VGAARRIFLASGNAGKLREYRELAAGRTINLDLLPGFDELSVFEETRESFAENAAGKVIHYSNLADGMVIADDSGLVVPALGGAPGVHSARYAGPGATSAQRIAKLLAAMIGLTGGQRDASFVCVLALAERGNVNAILSALVEGRILKEPIGDNGFGYDPIFFLPEMGRSLAELSPEEKNHWSHRGRAFRKLLEFIEDPRAAIGL
jgi:XTP/dITP diphosphohydrolase